MRTLATALLAFWAITPAAAPVPADGTSTAIRVTFDSVIHPVSVEIFRHALELAGRQHASFVVLRLNTPGGLLEATQQLVGLMQDASLPVVTVVTPRGGRAASAGFLLLLSGDVAVMVEGTRTGAATPVLLGKEMDQVLRKKVESDTAALVRGIASVRGRNSAAAEQAVLEARAFTAEEALKEDLIDLVVPDEASLLPMLDGRTAVRPGGREVILRTAGVRIVEYEPTVRERTVSAIADPNLSLPLVLLGALLLYVEFSSPGAIAPGVAGAILLLLGLAALSALPITLAGASLMILAVVLFVLEVKITSHGVLGAGGAVAMMLGALLLIEGPPEIRIRPATALAIALPFAAITVWLLGLVWTARRRPPAMGAGVLIEQPAIAVTDLSPRGTVLLRGEYWTAESSEPVTGGQKVRVIAVEGLLVRVEPAP